MSAAINIREDRSVKRRILDAAVEVFAEKGFGGARMDEIARRASINKAMLYYHIGDKDALYSAVLLDVIQGGWARISTDMKMAGSSEEKLKAIMEGMTEVATATQHFPRLILREWATGGAHLPEAVLKQLAKVFQIVQSILEEGKRAGHFRAVDPLMTHLCIIASIIVLSAAEPIKKRFRSMGIRTIPQKRFAGNIAGHVAGIVLNGIKKEQASKRR